MESPAKSRTLSRFLNNTSNRNTLASREFSILATGGHVFHVEKRDGQVDVEHDFRMNYQVDPAKSKFVNAIVRAMRQNDELYLATDPDREGEAISAHILQILKDRGVMRDKPVRRVVFHEITSEAVQSAIDHPGEIAVNLVEAQHARAALDYLVGFNLSPILWRRLASGLSAGRVQSPALRLIVERQREIAKFDALEFWSIHALVQADEDFSARLTYLNGEKLKEHAIQNEEQAQQAVTDIKSAMARFSESGNMLQVARITKSTRQRRPPAPFTTSTLVQAASRRLSMNANAVMRTAQQLYEGLEIEKRPVGLITYLRTDSVTIAKSAIAQIRAYIAETYGAKARPEKARLYRTKSRNAQEAHEAIRPTDINLTPQRVKQWLNKDQFRLYELIWKRTLACQMQNAVFDQVAVDLAVENHNFHATGSTLKYPGFLIVYEDVKSRTETEKNNDRADRSMVIRSLPPLQEGQSVLVDEIQTKQHFTQPPPRYNQASLVRTLEEYGIGRPSTYATIISTLLDREYCVLEKRQFIATARGCAVNDYLTENFKKYVNYNFTADLEEKLDDIANGSVKRTVVLSNFWKEFKSEVDDKIANGTRYERLLGTQPESGRDILVRYGKYGPYIQVGRRQEQEKPVFTNLPSEYDIGLVTLKDALKLLDSPQLPRVLEGAPEGCQIVARTGRYGPYVSVTKNGEKPFNVNLDKLDPFTVTVEQALELYEREKERRSRSNVIQEFKKGKLRVLDGRFGPYVTDGKINATVPKKLDPTTITEEECQELIKAKAARPRSPRRRRSAPRRSR